MMHITAQDSVQEVRCHILAGSTHEFSLLHFRLRRPFHLRRFFIVWRLRPRLETFWRWTGLVAILDRSMDVGSRVRLDLDEFAGVGLGSVSLRRLAVCRGLRRLVLFATGVLWVPV